MNYYFIGLLAICTAYALALGGAPERIGAPLYAGSCFVTYLILESHSKAVWAKLEYGILIVDVLTFVAFCMLALRAERLWPIWVSALLGLGVLGHLARWSAPELGRWAYAISSTIWSYPIVLLFALGVWNHHQRVRRNGSDRSWTRAEH